MRQKQVRLSTFSVNQLQERGALSQFCEDNFYFNMHNAYSLSQKHQSFVICLFVLPLAVAQQRYEKAKQLWPNGVK